MQIETKETRTNLVNIVLKSQLLSLLALTYLVCILVEAQLPYLFSRPNDSRVVTFAAALDA